MLSFACFQRCCFKSCSKVLILILACLRYVFDYSLAWGTWFVSIVFQVVLIVSSIYWWCVLCGGRGLLLSIACEYFVMIRNDLWYVERTSIKALSRLRHWFVNLFVRVVVVLKAIMQKNWVESVCSREVALMKVSSRGLFDVWLKFILVCVYELRLNMIGGQVLWEWS